MHKVSISTYKVHALLVTIAWPRIGPPLTLCPLAVVNTCTPSPPPRPPPINHALCCGQAEALPHGNKAGVMLHILRFSPLN